MSEYKWLPPSFKMPDTGKTVLGYFGDEHVESCFVVNGGKMRKKFIPKWVSSNTMDTLGEPIFWCEIDHPEGYGEDL